MDSFDPVALLQHYYPCIPCLFLIVSTTITITIIFFTEINCFDSLYSDSDIAMSGHPLIVRFQICHITHLLEPELPNGHTHLSV